MMLVPSKNVPHLNINVRHRLQYSGNVSRNYMSFKLLNVIASDAGFYRIESLCGTNIPGRKQLIVEASNDVAEENSTELNISTSTSTSNTAEGVTWNMFALGMAFVIGVVVVSLFMLGCLIRIQHTNTHRQESERRHSREQCNTNLCLTPINGERPLPISTPWEGGMIYSYATKSVQPNSGIHISYETENVGVNDYENANVSSHEDRPQLSHDKNIVHVTPENINEPCHDTSGYLTVLDTKDTIH